MKRSGVRVIVAAASDGKPSEHMTAKRHRSGSGATPLEEMTHIRRIELCEPIHQYLERHVAFDACLVFVV